MFLKLSVVESCTIPTQLPQWTRYLTGMPSNFNIYRHRCKKYNLTHIYILCISLPLILSKCKSLKVAYVLQNHYYLRWTPENIGKLGYKVLIGILLQFNLTRKKKNQVAKFIAIIGYKTQQIFKTNLKPINTKT